MRSGIVALLVVLGTGCSDDEVVQQSLCDRVDQLAGEVADADNSDAEILDDLSERLTRLAEDISDPALEDPVRAAAERIDAVQGSEVEYDFLGSAQNAMDAAVQRCVDTGQLP